MEQFFIFVLGLFFGSFANVCVRRIPYGNSIAVPASHCPKCLIPIRWTDNIPVLSYLMLRGKCRICGNGISFQYPLVEILTGLYFLMSYQRFGITGMLAGALAVGLLLIIISFIDFNLRIIPDSLSLALLAAGLAFSPFNLAVNRSFVLSAAGVLLGGLSIWAIAWAGRKIYKKEVMGAGDVKLLAAGGSVAGIRIIYALMIACFLGAFFGIMSVALRKNKISDLVPFGPYIAAGIILVFFWGDSVVRFFSFFML